MRFSISAVVVFVFLVAVSASAEVMYTVTDLGTLGGTQPSSASGINNAGQVVGYSTTADGEGHAFLWSSGTMSDLGTLPGHNGSSASAINNLGQIVGASNGHSVLWSQGQLVDLGRIAGGFDDRGRAINDNGEVAGVSVTFNGQSRAFLWSNGTMTALAGSGSGANGINNRGQVVGQAYSSSGPTHAFLWSNGTSVDLGTLPGHSASDAFAINDSGQIVGASDFRACIWENGVPRDLGTLPWSDFNLTKATAINTSGQIVGNFVGYQPVIDDYYRRALFWNNGTMKILDDLIEPSSGWRIEYASAINDAGQIIASGVNPEGYYRAILLTPVPEPSSLLLLGLGAIALLRKR